MFQYKPINEEEVRVIENIIGLNINLKGSLSNVNSLYGLVGNKLSHSLSMSIHNRIFNILKLEAYYHLFEVKPTELNKAILGLGSIGAVGINVTIPYKCEVIDYLEEVSEEAAKIGAVNTIKFVNGRTIGYNTDYFGFKSMIEKNGIDSKWKNVVILGNGGGADAVLQYFLDLGTKKIYVISRKLYETKLKYKNRNVIICSYEDLEKIKDAEIIINCTPCGMYPDVGVTPVRKSILSNFKCAIDLVYNPVETLFLRNASQCGLTTLNGLYMLVAQAVAAQHIWNDINIGTEVIDRIYEELKLANNSK
jgi:shikimate dehydrogenase